jgi:hypothetical protein
MIRRAMTAFRLLLLLPLLLSAGCSLDLDYGQYAIVYGISDYPETDNDLSYTDEDAREFADVLDAQGYQVILRVTDDGGNQATYNQLIADFAYVSQNAGLDDLFLFYFSGHGDQAPASAEDSETSLGSDSFDEVLVLVDDSLTKTVDLPDDELAVYLRTIPCARKVVIIDACNSGGFIGNQLEVDAVPPSLAEGSTRNYFERIGDAVRLYSNYGDGTSDISPSEALVIAASGEREYSYEAPDPKNPDEFQYYHGVMTYFLLEAVTGGDYNRDGYVTVTEAYRYIARNIQSEWNREHSFYFQDFFPHVSGGPVDYILFAK